MVSRKEKANPVRFEPLDSINADEIPGPYIAAFSMHRWHEQYECKCGVIYADGCDRVLKGEGACTEFFTRPNLFLRKGSFCGNCGQPLESSLKPVWTEEGVRADFLEDCRREGFLAIGVRSPVNELLGFFWGFRLPEETTHHVDFLAAARLLSERGIDPRSVFYHDEAGLYPKEQGKGYGSTALRNLLKTARTRNRSVVFRTINPAIVRCYEKVFGLDKGGLKPAFPDPIPTKDQLWYVLNLEAEAIKD